MGVWVVSALARANFATPLRLPQDGSGTLELDEFKRLIDQSPMAGKYGEQQLLQMFSELTTQDGLLTKHDWTNLFHHVQVDFGLKLQWRMKIAKEGEDMSCCVLLGEKNGILMKQGRSIPI